MSERKFDQPILPERFGGAGNPPRFLEEIDALASKVHDAIYAEPFDRKAASDAVWEIHNLLRPLLTEIVERGGVAQMTERQPDNGDKSVGSRHGPSDETQNTPTICPRCGKQVLWSDNPSNPVNWPQWGGRGVKHECAPQGTER